MVYAKDTIFCAAVTVVRIRVKTVYIMQTMFSIPETTSHLSPPTCTHTIDWKNRNLNQLYGLNLTL